MNSRRLYTVRVRELAELAAAQLGLPVVEAFAAPAAAEDPVADSGRLRQVTQRLQLQRAGITGTVLLVDDFARSKMDDHAGGVLPSGGRGRGGCAGGGHRGLTHAMWRPHNGAMPSIQIKDVPAETHAVLRRRAVEAHQSLQEYLLAWLIAEASAPTLDEVLDRAGGRAGGALPLSRAVAYLNEDRPRR